MKHQAQKLAEAVAVFNIGALAGSTHAAPAHYTAVAKPVSTALARPSAKKPAAPAPKPRVAVPKAALQADGDWSAF